MIIHNAYSFSLAHRQSDRQRVINKIVIVRYTFITENCIVLCLLFKQHYGKVATAFLPICDGTNGTAVSLTHKCSQCSHCNKLSLVTEHELLYMNLTHMHTSLPDYAGIYHLLNQNGVV